MPMIRSRKMTEMTGLGQNIALERKSRRRELTNLNKSHAGRIIRSVLLSRSATKRSKPSFEL